MDALNVTLTWAQSLDGYIAKPGERTLLSGSESMKMTHSIRATHDAIVVGINTVLIDNPLLNTRLVPGPSPRPVILDSTLRLQDCRFFDRQPLILTLSQCKSDIQRLQDKGAVVVTLKDMQVPTIIETLKAFGCKKIMVEGGAQVLKSFLEYPANVIITIAPCVLGSGISPYIPIQLHHLGYQQMGQDMVYFGHTC